MKGGLPFNILIVEDDEDDRFMFDAAFLEIGYDSEVKKFIDGKAMLHYLDQIEPDLHPSLIVLDNRLGELDATDIVVKLKSNSLLSSIPIIVYSTIIAPGRKQELLGLGVIACLQKAGDYNGLLSVAKEFRRIAEEYKIA